MCCRCLLLVFIWNIFANDWSLHAGVAKLATMGRHFILSFPTISQDSSSRIVFYLVTLNEEEFQVNLTTEKFTLGENLNVQLLVKKTKAADYALDSKYFYKTTKGRKWTYRLEGVVDFSVTVLLQESRESVATLIALPDTSWGKHYYVVTLEKTPFIQIIASLHPVQVTVGLVIKTFMNDANLTFTYEGISYISGDVFTIALNSLEAFEISECSRRADKGSFLGSKVTAQRPVGVVSGSCNSPSLEILKICRSPMKSPELTAEMIIPLDMYQTDFTVPVYEKRKSTGLVVLITLSNNTNICYPNEYGFTECIEVKMPGGTYFAQLNPLYSTKKEVVGFNMQFTPCSSDSPAAADYELGDASLSLIVPRELYHFIYIVYTPHVKNATHYIMLITDKDYTYSLLMDGEAFENTVNWSSVKSTKDVVGSVNVVEGVHEVRSKSELKFACYLYGHGHRFSYMHPAGFISVDVKQECERRDDQMYPGDQIDNDCDGRLDEEKRDKIDNDGDKETDEDLENDLVEQETTELSPQLITEQGLTVNVTVVTAAPNKTVKGKWLDWKDWSCTQDCTELRLFRERVCFHADATMQALCQGLSKEFKPSVCFSNQPCPTGCPDFTWGIGCKLICSNCVDPCNKFNGTCKTCKPGYKNPDIGCRSPCDPFTFGEHCQEDCTQKCGRECYDRTNGDCNSSNMYLLLVPTTAALLMPCCFLVCCRRAKHIVESEAGTSSVVFSQDS